MKGFLRRDLYHLLASGGFYLCFMGVMGALALFTDFSGSFLHIYAIIFCASSVVGLFNYDAANHWDAYAAAVPNGRRRQVDARYLVGLAVIGVAMAMMLLLSLLGREEGGWALALLYGGMGLVYLALVCPLQYRFGYRSRLVVIIIVALLAGVFGAAGTMGVLSGGMNADKSPLLAAALPLIAVGLLGLLISHRVSLAIMAKKEF